MINDYEKVVLSTDNSSLKVLQQGSGALTTTGLPGSGSIVDAISIPHGFGSDNLIFQVRMTNAGQGFTIPWNSNDGRAVLWAGLDATNLYIYAESNDSSGFGFPATTYQYYYRIIIP